MPRFPVNKPSWYRKACLRLAGALLVLAGAFAIAAPDRGLSDHLRERLAAQRAGVPLQAAGRPLRRSAATQQLYAERLYEPIWFRGDSLAAYTGAVAGLLAAADEDGLRPDDYAGGELLQAFGRIDSPPAAQQVELELALTDAVIAYASDILLGRVRPEDLFPAWESPPPEIDLADRMTEMLAADDPAGALADLTPRHRHYQRLKSLLARLREVQRRGGWTAVPPGPALKPGMRSERATALRERLAQSGDWFEEHDLAEADLVDSGLVAAVRRYQRRHGLEPDGVAGAATIESLNVPVSRRIHTVELNMERWRWLPHELGDRYITVNIAGFELTVVEHDAPQLVMPVVVGKRYHATPVFSGSMSYLVFSPYWNVPMSIATREILPKLRTDPAYLERESIRVFRGWQQPDAPLDPALIDWSSVEAAGFPYRFRQEPGPGNALGQVKFMFPNKYNVYLHDTPAKELFSRAARDFSHGCIRVSDPLGLAEYLLRDTGEWGRARITEAAGRGVEQAVPLARTWSVHLLYWTAWVGSAGEVNFRPDIYLRDERLATALGD